MIQKTRNTFTLWKLKKEGGLSPDLWSILIESFGKTHAVFSLEKNLGLQRRFGLQYFGRYS